MQVDALALKLRPRSHLEACDLGVRLCQHAAGSVFPCHGVALCVALVPSLATAYVDPWLPLLTLWWLKPWMERAALFALSRAAFGQRVRLRDLWTERSVLWGQLLLTLTLRRLSPWRSFTQPVYQLEGLRGLARWKRVRQIRSLNASMGAALSFLFSVTEWLLLLALGSLTYWFMPEGYELDLRDWFFSQGAADWWVGSAFTVLYAGVLAFVAPFYVGAGFGLYLNRRVELEAWDLEQEFRRAFTP